MVAHSTFHTSLGSARRMLVPIGNATAQRRGSRRLRRGLPPGPEWPVVAQTLAFIGRPGPFMQRCHIRYGDMFAIRLAYEGDWVIIAHPELAREVFTGDPSVLHAGEANRLLLPLLGRFSLLVQDEHEHLIRRKLVLPPFHGDRIQGFAGLMREIAEREIERWPVNQPFAILPSMQRITLEVIMRTVFGAPSERPSNGLAEALRDLLGWFTSPRALLALFTLGPKLTLSLTGLRRHLRRVDRILYREITRSRRDPDLGARDDVLSLLLLARFDDGQAMNDEDVRDQLVTLLIAGHETTATALAWAVERLLRTPAAFGRLVEEIAAGDEGYLNAVCLETLRLRPVLPLVGRRLTEPMRIGEYRLPAGTRVAPSVHLIHRRPDLYPDPTQFRPERFLDTPPGTYSWIPFGGGVRRCVGSSFALLEMRVVLQAIVERGRLSPVSPQGEPVRRRSLTWAPREGTAVIREPLPARRPPPDHVRHSGALHRREARRR
jgi:cytochrome P450 family 135